MIPFDGCSHRSPHLLSRIFEPHFSTRLEVTGDKINLAVVKELETQPWVVVFAQPEEVFLAPIKDQTRITLFLAIAIAGVVTAAAFTMEYSPLTL